MKFLKIALLAICLLLGVNAISSAELSRDEALSQFVSAGIAYKDGRYDEAIERYRSILNNRLESGAVHYNLANSYFKKNKLGKAIASYERAKRHMPRDSDLRFNSDYAQSQIDQYIEPKKGGLLQKAMKRHIEFYTIDEMTLIILGLFALLGATHIISLLVGRNTNYTAGGAIALSVLIALFACGMYLKGQMESNLAVAISNIDAYFEPRNDATVHFKVSEGMTTRLIKEQGRWVKIERIDGKQGWVDLDILEKI